MPFARVERNILAGLSQLIYAMSFAAKEICVLRAGQGVFSQEAFRYGNTRCKPCFQSATPPPASLHATLVGPRSFVQYGHGLGKCATRLVSWAHRSDTPRVNRLPALRLWLQGTTPPPSMLTAPKRSLSLLLLGAHPLPPEPRISLMGCSCSLFSVPLLCPLTHPFGCPFTLLYPSTDAATAGGTLPGNS